MTKGEKAKVVIAILILMIVAISYFVRATVMHSPSTPLAFPAIFIILFGVYVLIKLRRGQYGKDGSVKRHVESSVVLDLEIPLRIRNSSFSNITMIIPLVGGSEMVERIVSERLIDRGHPSMIGRSVIVSPDSRRVAYVAREGKKWFVVVDGQEQKQYDRIEAPSLVFSPDGQRVAYVARAVKKRFVVVDGQEQKQYDRIEVPSLVFGPDSQRWTYLARAGRKWFVVVDGKEQTRLNRIQKGSLLFSPDSQRVAYAASEGGKWFVVVDGREQERHDGIQKDSLAFSPDSQRVAYVGGWQSVLRFQTYEFVVVDGTEQKQYVGIGSFVFSPDGQRVAYVAYANQKYFVVLDGQEQKPYENVSIVPMFSPDSQRLALAVRFDNRDNENHVYYEFVVVDGREGMAHSWLAPPVFSPDSKRLAYVAREAREPREQLVVVDGQKGRYYDEIVAARRVGTVGPVVPGVIFDSPNQLQRQVMTFPLLGIAASPIRVGVLWDLGQRIISALRTNGKAQPSNLLHLTGGHMAATHYYDSIISATI